MTGSVKYCTHEIKTLELEGRWLLSLAILQAVFNTVFIVWKVYLLNVDRQIIIKSRQE